MVHNSALYVCCEDYKKCTDYRGALISVAPGGEGKRAHLGHYKVSRGVLTGSIPWPYFRGVPISGVSKVPLSLL